jgi:hypothetical protein
MLIHQSPHHPAAGLIIPLRTRSGVRLRWPHVLDMSVERNGVAHFGWPPRLQALPSRAVSAGATLFTPLSSGHGTAVQRD